MTAKKTPEDYGRLAYDEYCAAVGGRSVVSGELLPTWDETRTQRPDIARAWIKAAAAVFIATSQDLLEHVGSGITAPQHAAYAPQEVIAEAIRTGRAPEEMMQAAAEAYLEVNPGTAHPSIKIYLGHRDSLMQQEWMHAVIVTVLRMAAKPKNAETTAVDVLAARVLQEHLIVGPRTGQCLCGFGDETMPVQFLGRPHAVHVVEMLREAGVLKEEPSAVVSGEENTDEATSST